MKLSNNNKKLSLALFIIFLYVFFFLNYSYAPCKGGFTGGAIDHIYIARTLDKPYFLSSLWEDTIYAKTFSGISDSFGFTSIVFVLSTVTNIAPKYVIFIPLAGIVSSLVYFIINREIFNDSKIPFLLCSYFILFSSTTGLIEGYVAGWAFLLYSLIVFISIKLSSGINTKTDPCYIIILILSYLGIMGIWHTMEVRALAFILVINVFLLITNMVTKKYEYKPRLFVTISFFVTTLTFKKFWYDIFPNSGVDILVNSYLDVFSKFMNLFLESATYSPSKYYYVAPNSFFNSLYLYFELLMLIFIFAPLFLSFLTVDIQSIKRKTINKKMIIKWSIVVSYAVVAILYGLKGGAGPGLIFHIFPIAATISMAELIEVISPLKKIPNLLYFYLIALILLQAGLTTLSIDKSIQMSYDGDYENVHFSSSWYFEHSLIENNVTQKSLTDFFTAGLYVVEGAENGYIFDYKVWDPKSYELIDTLQKVETSYLIINYIDFGHPVLRDQGWNQLEPLSLYKKELYANAYINCVYSDGFFIICEN